MERAIVEYLANAFWQVPLLVGAVAGLLWALGSDVRTRHRVWLAVLAIALLLPLRGMAPEATDQETVIFSSSALPVPMGAPHGAHRSAPAADVDFAVPRTKLKKPSHQAGIVLGPKTTRWVVRFYLAALAFAGWRILRAWFAAQGLLRRSRSIDLAPRALAIFAQTADSQEVPLPRLRQSDETVSPVVIGAVRPVLLLPAGFDRLPDDEIRAALSHEFAHLARRDYLVNLLCQIFALPLAWHPAVHYVQKRIRDTREMLCDAVAAEEMASPVRYATCLVAFALRALDGPDGALATQGVSMFDNRILEERIAQLTQAPERPEASTRLARLAGATAGLVLAVAMALLLHITPTWAETPVAPIAEPVQLTPPAELPAAPEAPPAPPAAPTAPSRAKSHHVHIDDDTKRAIAEEEHQRADRQREQDQLARDEAQRQRDEGQRQREAAHEEAQHQREIAQLQRDEAQRQRDAARDQADRQRELQRQVTDQQREASREAIEEARRGAVEASRAYASEVKRQVAEAVRAGQAVQDVDMEKIKLEISQATAAVHTPEFKAQMAELQTHIQKLHDNMAQLRDQMKVLNREVERSSD